MVTSFKRRLPARQSEKRRLGLLQQQVLPREPDDCRSNMSSRVLCMGGCPAETGSKTEPGKGRSRRKKVCDDRGSTECVPGPLSVCVCLGCRYRQRNLLFYRSDTAETGRDQTKYHGKFGLGL